MKITRRQIRQLIQERIGSFYGTQDDAAVNLMSLVTNELGERNTVGKMLSLVAGLDPIGLLDTKLTRERQLAMTELEKNGLVEKGLHPAGGIRWTVTSAGRTLLAWV